MIGVTEDYAQPEIVSTRRHVPSVKEWHRIATRDWDKSYHLLFLQRVWKVFLCSDPFFSLLEKGSGESVRAHSCNVECGGGAVRGLFIQGEWSRTGVLYHASTTATQKCPMNNCIDMYQLSYNKLWSHPGNVIYLNIAIYLCFEGYS